MSVQIVPVGFLQPMFPAVDLEVDGKTVDQILQELEIRSDLVAVVLINGRQASKSAVVRDGDVVKLVPFVGGG